MGLERTYYVYELVNNNNEVEYVGMSYRPEYRFKQHTKHKPSVGVGKFYGRDDLSLHIRKGFDKGTARIFECMLQLYRGFVPEDENLAYKITRLLGTNETD